MLTVKQPEKSMGGEGHISVYQPQIILRVSRPVSRSRIQQEKLDQESELLRNNTQLKKSRLKSNNNKEYIIYTYILIKNLHLLVVQGGVDLRRS
jgi:hypothetical protein